MVVERRVSEVMSTPVRQVSLETPLQEAVQLMSEHHISALAVVDGTGALVGELTEQDLMVRESGFEAGPYVMLLDSVIYLRNPLNLNYQRPAAPAPLLPSIDRSTIPPTTSPSST